jgi:hypothetical protein
MKFNLSKPEMEKLGLGAALFAVLLYAYFFMMLGPLNDKEKKARAAIGEMQPKIDEAKAQIEKTQALEAKAPSAQKSLEQIKALIPEGAPVAWFPPRMQDFFKNQGIDKAATRLSNETTDKDLPGFRKITWSIDLPKVGFLALGRAVAELENKEPLLEITNLQIEAVKEDPELSHAVITVATIVKQ